MEDGMEFRRHIRKRGEMERGEKGRRGEVRRRKEQERREKYHQMSRTETIVEQVNKNYVKWHHIK
jgi:hypothetical protein